MNEKPCPFCKVDRELIRESKLSFAIFDKYPVGKGHVLVIAKRHVSNYFDMGPEEVKDIWDLVTEIKTYLQNKYKPDGFNVGFNIGIAAGQTIGHVHIHVIPRYIGDMEDPTGGVRYVIPEKGKY